MSADVPVLLHAVVIDSTNGGLRITEGANTSTTLIPAGTYYLRGDGTADDLLLAIKTAMETNTAPRVSVNTYTVAVAWSTDPAAVSAVVTITRATGADTFGVLWADALTTFDQALLGFAVSDTVNASAKTSTKSPSAVWVCDGVYREYEPADAPQGYSKRARSGFVRQGKTGETHKDRGLVVSFVSAARTHEMHIAADPERAFNRFLDRWRAGRPAELHLATATGTVLGALSSSTESGAGWHLGGDPEEKFDPPRTNLATASYSWSFELWPVVV